jgi:hypothetical protein
MTLQNETSILQINKLVNQDEYNWQIMCMKDPICTYNVAWKNERVYLSVLLIFTLKKRKDIGLYKLWHHHSKKFLIPKYLENCIGVVKLNVLGRCGKQRGFTPLVSF